MRMKIYSKLVAIKAATHLAPVICNVCTYKSVLKNKYIFFRLLSTFSYYYFNILLFKRESTP